MNITVLPGNIAADRSPLQIAREFADGQLRLPGAALSDGPREMRISGRTAAFYAMTFGASPGSATPVPGASRVWVVAHNGLRLFIGARVPAPDVPEAVPELDRIVGNLRLTDPTEFDDPARAALAWLELLDGRQIAAAWVAADEAFRNERSLQRWASDADQISAAMGTPTSRGAPSASPTRGDDGKANPMDDQLVLRFNVMIDSGKRATEVLLMRRRPGTGWRVATYAIVPGS
jgi:hypothetical protein